MQQGHGRTMKRCTKMERKNENDNNTLSICRLDATRGWMNYFHRFYLVI